MKPEKKETKGFVYSFTISAFLFGIVFGFTVILIDLSYRHLSYDFKSIALLHRINPILWFFDLAPFLLALVAFISESIISTNKIKTRLQIQRIKDSINTSLFAAKEMSNGNFDITIELSENTDLFTVYLRNIQMRLKEFKYNELAQHNEYKQRTWTAQVISEFNQLLHVDNSDIEGFSYKILINLIKHLGANQGGVFVINDNDPTDLHFELKAFHAYDKKKLMQKKVYQGEGLIGSVIIERQSIFLKDLPPDYISLTSGLGDAPPRNLMIVPCKIVQDVYAIIEIASFQVFEEYQIDLIEKLAESIGSTIATTLSNQRTSQLLKESQLQRERLAEQDEVMMQHLEDLERSQKESLIKQLELDENSKMLKNIIDLVPFPVFVKDHERKYIIVNKAQAKLFDRNSEDFIGKTDNELLSDNVEADLVKESDERILVLNEVVNLPEQQITFPDGHKRLLQTTKVPFFNNVTAAYNILGVSIDTTGQRMVYDENRKMLTNLIDLVPFPIFVKNEDFRYTVINKSMARLYNQNQENIVGKRDRDIIDDEMLTVTLRNSDERVLFNSETLKLPEREITFPNGETRVMQISKVPFMNNLTKSLNILGVAVDYTQHRLETEEQMKMFKNIIDIVPLPIFVKDFNYRYLIVNKAEADLYNMKAEEMINKSDDELLSDKEAIIGIRISDNTVLHNNETVKLPEQEIMLPNGKLLRMQTIKVPFYNDNLKEKNILGVSLIKDYI